MTTICIGNCYPPKEAFPLWDLVTGSAPVNEYSMLGYQMLMLSYILALFLIPMIGYTLVLTFKLIRDLTPGKYNCDGTLRVKQ
jgi:hypothetical protein